MKEAYTSKLYWKKWTHKVTLDLGDTYTGSQLEEHHRTANFKVKKLNKDLASFVKSHLDAESKILQSSELKERVWPTLNVRSYSYYSTLVYRYNGRVNIYFKDASFLETIQQSEWKDKISYVEKPYNDAHLVALEKEKVVFRKTLWWDKYRYRMKSNHYPVSPYHHDKRTDVAAEIEKWINDNLVKLRKRVSGQDFTVTTGYYAPSTYFFAHAEDAMMFRLTWGTDMKIVERAKLYSELDEVVDA